MEPVIRRRDDGVGRFVLGAPVLVTRNERGEGVSSLANGDLGVLIDDGERAVVFGTETNVVRRLPDQLGEAESAWAITIHKSQGSEYDEVVVSLPEHDVSILTRELLYTAITRARQRVTIVASNAVLERVLARHIERVSGLSDRTSALSARTSRK